MTFIGRRINYISKKNKSKNKIFYNDWKNINYESVSKKISSIDLKSDNINKNCNDLNDNLHQLIKAEIPLKTKYVRNISLEKWIDSEVLSAINQKNIIHKKYIEERKDGTLTQYTTDIFKNIRNKTNVLIKKKKR